VDEIVREGGSRPYSYSPIKGSTVAATVIFESVREAHGLVVGQKVRLSSGYCSISGVVTRITTLGIEVQDTASSDLLHFDQSGKGRDNEATLECGLWYIVREGR
jgi:hypothetical protein